MKLKFGMIGGGGGGIGHVHLRGALIDQMNELTAACFSRNKDINEQNQHQAADHDAAEGGLRLGGDHQPANDHQQVERQIIALLFFLLLNVVI